jgi:hypothetical protein
MPAFLEAKLKKEYGADSKVPYKVMNSIGAMGKRMEKKHAAKVGGEKMRSLSDLA